MLRDQPHRAGVAEQVGTDLAFIEVAQEDYVDAAWSYCSKGKDSTALVFRPELRDPASLLPKLDVVPLCKSLRLLPGDFVVGTDQLNALNNVAIRPDKVCSVFRHGGPSLRLFIA